MPGASRIRGRRLLLAATLPVLVLAGGCALATAPSASAPAPAAAKPRPAVDAKPADSGKAPTPSPVAAAYADAAQRILEAAEASDDAYRRLGHLSDRIGPRLAGSAALDEALAWARDAFVADGQDKVRLEPVLVPHWERGKESATLLHPLQRDLAMLGLGGSVATPPKGIAAELLVVSSFEELEARAAQAKGRIVLFDHAMSPDVPPGQAYGEALPYRITGASRAAAFGAVAVLVRSLTAHSLGAPHTGAMRYVDPDVPKIPAAALSVEDATLLHRLADRGGRPMVHLRMTCETRPDAKSANVVAEIRGRELPGEIVLIGAHLDSWDVGQGAQDNGAGVVVVMEALRILRTLGLQPRRTIRAVLFTNEENGIRGAEQYVLDHASELARHVGAIEIDTGAGAPLGFRLDGEQPFFGDVEAIAALLAPIDATAVTHGYAGADVMKLQPARVPLLGMSLEMSTYFDVHHSVADTYEKVDPGNLRKSAAAMATMAYVLADQEASWRAELPAAPKP